MRKSIIIMSDHTATNDNSVVSAVTTLHRNSPSYVEPYDSSSSNGGVSVDETAFEMYSDYILGGAFVVTAFVAAKRIRANRSGSTGAAESAVMTSFYSLIFVTAAVRALYFLIPASWWQPSYTPVAVNAWDGQHPAWVGYALAELTVTAGSLTLFSIFILILVYWADILKKYYNPGSRRSLPMSTFLLLVLLLVGAEIINTGLFLAGFYTTEGMILFNAVLLSVTSMICVAQITLFSRKFQNVLKTLGAINQVSTDSQVRRIVWITVTGNLFFLTRAGLETIFATYLIVYWWNNGTVARAFSHAWWDTYTVVKYVSELTILALMLHILQSRFSNNTNNNGASQQQQPSQGNNAGYAKVPDVAPPTASANTAYIEERRTVEV
jgi:hypothetical protein